jgi:hypothetical protein
MADRNFRKGSKYRVYLSTSGNYASPTWAHIKCVPGTVVLNPNPTDIAVEGREDDVGHLHGDKDPSFAFTLNMDDADSNVETILAAMHSGAMLHLAIAAGNIATNGTKYQHMQCVLFGPENADRASVAQLEITANRHANSEFNLARATVSG